jgi:hypothetical protein
LVKGSSTSVLLYVSLSGKSRSALNAMKWDRSERDNLGWLTRRRSYPPSHADWVPARGT